MTAVMWKRDPVWDRLSKQPSWAKLNRVLSLQQRVLCDVKYSAITRGYRCELTKYFNPRYAEGDHIPTWDYRFAAEGHGQHPLGAIRAALARLDEPILLSVRLLLLAALVEFLQVEVQARCDEAR